MSVKHKESGIHRLPNQRLWKKSSAADDKNILSNNIRHIPLHMIEPRPENRYPLTDLKRLEESIERSGVLQPIILRKISEDRYSIIAGERRYTASKRLYERFINNGDTESANRFAQIPAIVLDVDDVADEEIYRGTNDYTRQMNTLQKIAFLNPDRIDMKDPYWQREYVRRVFGDKKVISWEAGLFTVKGNKQERAKLVSAILHAEDPNCDASEKTVRNYLALLDRSSEELRQAVIAGDISIREAMSLSWNEEYEQQDAVTSLDEPVFQDYVEEGTVLSGAPARKQTRTATKVSRKLRSYETRLKKISSDFSKLIDGVSDIDSFSPEDREIIDKIQTISSLLSASKESDQ